MQAHGTLTKCYLLNEDFACVVDLEVIKTRTNVPSATTQRDSDFIKLLLRRDVCCVWTGIDGEIGEALHIIPHRQGSEVSSIIFGWEHLSTSPFLRLLFQWLQLIIANRPSCGGNVAGLHINDIRNGIFVSGDIHTIFDQRRVAVLKVCHLSVCLSCLTPMLSSQTPNPILTTEDVPPSPDRRFDVRTIGYPIDSRYTMQWLQTLNASTMNIVKNNSDAAFRHRCPERDRPSDVLLHYTYGAAAVKNWGRNTNVLQTLGKPPRPPKPVEAPAGPSQTIHERSATVGKLDKSIKQGRARARAGGLVDTVGSKGEATWDEDDVMLFLWGNTETAKERHRRKASEDIRRVEQWRGGVSV